MGYIRHLPDESCPSLQQMQESLGFIPNFFRSQTLRLDLVDAEMELGTSLLVKDGALTRVQKEYVFLVCAAANLSTYCVTLHCEMIRMLGVSGPEPEQIAIDHNSTNLPIPMKALLNFALKLNKQMNKVGRSDIDALRTFGFTDEQILETVVTVGFAKFANTIAYGLGTVPDFDPKFQVPGTEVAHGSYLQQLPDETCPRLGEMMDKLGFIPNFYRAQTMRPDLVEAETDLMTAVILKEGALSRQHKEYVFLVCAAANLSTYCVAAHCEIVRSLGLKGPEPEQIALDHTATNLPIPMKALLNFALKLNNQGSKIRKADIDALRTFGYTDQQILEAVVVVGLGKFANFIAFGLGTVPDFEPAEDLRFGYEPEHS